MRAILAAIVEWAVLISGSAVCLAFCVWALSEAAARIFIVGKAWERLFSYTRNRKELARWSAHRRVEHLRRFPRGGQ